MNGRNPIPYLWRTSGSKPVVAIIELDIPSPENDFRLENESVLRRPQEDVGRVAGRTDGENVVIIEQMPTAEGEVAVRAEFGKRYTRTVTHGETLRFGPPNGVGFRAESEVVVETKSPFIEIGPVTTMALGDI